MPHIGVKLLQGKTEKQKKELAQALIKAAQEVIGFGDESYSISIEDFTFEEWKNNVYPNDIMGRKDILFKKPGYEM
ncbi:MAG: tautomerase family protein [Aequorivita sp.]|jgi:4-oxalocrotonate tautomerase|nr:tautomerase family protein [Aequorivita sp.]